MRKVLLGSEREQRVLLLRALDDEDYLPPLLTLEREQGALRHALVQLGHLADGVHLSVAEDVAELRRKPPDVVGSGVYHDGQTSRRRALHRPPPRALLLGQETEEDEALALHPGERHRGHHGAGSGDAFDIYPLPSAKCDDFRARVGDGGHPRIRDERDVFALSHQIDYFKCAFRLVKLMICDRPSIRADLGKQRTGMAGVFAGDDVRRAEGLLRTRREVAEVAYRGADNEKFRHQR